MSEQHLPHAIPRRRHNEKGDDDFCMRLLQTIENVQHRQSIMEKAFPKNPEGQPDFSGHCAEHQARIDFYKARTEVLKGIAKKLAEVSVIGFIGWMAVAAWHEVVKALAK